MRRPVFEGDFRPVPVNGIALVNSFFGDFEVHVAFKT